MTPGGQGACPRPSFSPFLGRNGDPAGQAGPPGRCAPRLRKSPDHPKGTQYPTASPPGTGRETTSQGPPCAGPERTPCRGAKPPPSPLSPLETHPKPWYNGTNKTRTGGGGCGRDQAAGIGFGRNPPQRGEADLPPHPGGPGPGTAAGGAGGARHRAALPGDPPGGAEPAGAAVRGELQRGHHPGPGHGTGAAGKAPPRGHLPGGAGPLRPGAHAAGGLPGRGGVPLPGRL